MYTSTRCFFYGFTVDIRNNYLCLRMARMRHVCVYINLSMSRDNSEWPNLDFSLKDVVQILQSGGRLTRSRKNPTSKQPEPKQKDRSKSLLKYEGEPCLHTYLTTSNVAYQQPIKEGYFLNKKMKRLNKQHLPQSCMFFEKNYNSGYILKPVKLICKKAKPNEFIIQQREQANKIPLARSITGLQNGILTVPQALVFIVLSYEEFIQLFQRVLLELKQKYRNLKLEELAQLQMSEQKERSLQGENLSENLQNEMVPEQKEQRNAIDSVLSLGSAADIKQEQSVSVRDGNSQQPLQIVHKINQELNDLELKIFNKISKGNKFILWPSLVLSPLNAERNDLQVLAARQQSIIQQNQGNRLQYQLQQQIFQIAFEQLYEFRSEESERNIETEQSLSEKIQILLQQVEQSSVEPTVLNLVGTSKTKLMQRSFLKWQSFNFEEISHILLKSPLRVLLQQLNTYILALNKFKALESSPFEAKHSLYRISKYQPVENGQSELCIAIRCDQQRQDKKVLVRLLKDDFEGENEQLLKWVEQNKLKINLTVPRQSQEEKKFYYLLGNYISVQDGLHHIFSDYYYQPSSFIKVLRQCYPEYEIRRTISEKQRCIYCYYPMDDLPCYRCKYCLKFCHQECSPIHNIRHSETEVEELSIDIYETDRDDRVWQCQECAPCNECHMAVNKNYLKCSGCNNLFHGICGKLKGSGESTLAESKYTCQNCLKCRICSNKLKNQEYIIQEGSIFCLKCHKDFKNDNYCAICMKQVHGKWVQCDIKECKKWIHLSCDSYFRGREAKEGLDKANYICPSCRLKERRKLFKWVIEELKCFDEYQYFYDAEYEDITGYSEVITNPLCIYQMREKVVDGKYDNDTYNLIREDLELVVKNALTFNMPKDQPHYRAKILLIVGLKFLEKMKDMLECTEQFLVNGGGQEIFKQKKKEFYLDLYENYLSYLLNFRSEKTKIQVRKTGHMPLDGDLFFSSKLILSHSFVNSEFKFRIKKKPHKIQNLFTIPRLSPSCWRPIRAQLCYYHPQESNPLIFECSICRESYCCTTVCLNHRVCSICNVKGCACDSPRCGCIALREKERKSMQSRAASALGQSRLSRRQYTEYYRYCLKCVLQNLKTHWCYLCRGFCYYNYESCLECNKFYHLSCEKKQKMDEMLPFYQLKQIYQQNYENLKLPQLCYSCSSSPKNIDYFQEVITQQIKAKAIKLYKIQKYLPVFQYLYEEKGIRLTHQEILKLVYANYESFTQKQIFFDDYLDNFNIINEARSNNRIMRSDFRDYFINEINRKIIIQSSHPHEKCLNFVETKEIKELKQSKKYFKIFSKWFNNISVPAKFVSTYDIKCHLQHLTSKMSHASGYHLRDASQAYQITEQHLIATSSKDEIQCNYKNLERIKIEVITSYISPKSKKNIYYTNKLEKLKNYLNFWNAYYNYKERISRNSKEMVNEDIENQKIKDKQKIQKEYEVYLRFHSDHQSISDCIYKQQSSRALLLEPVHRDNFNPFHQIAMVSKYRTMSYYREDQNAYVNKKSQMLYSYLTSYCLKIYQENKVVLRKGNTCILAEGKNLWRVLKKYKNQTMELKLEKKNQVWYLQINQWCGVVREIKDIVQKLKGVSPEISTFEDIAEFMGFNMTYSTFYEPNHFTHLLQTLPLDELNRQQRKARVIKEYEQYDWQRQGNFSLKKQEEGVVKQYKYNVTKKEIFYLKKRNQNQSQEEDLFEPKVVPFITFEDIKKDLSETNGVALREKDNFTIKEPTNDVYVAPSKIDRLGLFIRNFTKKNTIVTEYIGEIISQAMADLREKKFHFGCYMFGLTKNNTRFQIIDATFVGNMGRYLNHSCDPNCKARIQISNGQPRILIYTVRDVQANEELTYDYQFKIDGNERLICKCKAHNCQGRLT